MPTNNDIQMRDAGDSGENLIVDHTQHSSTEDLSVGWADDLAIREATQALPLGSRLSGSSEIGNAHDSSQHTDCDSQQPNSISSPGRTNENATSCQDLTATQNLNMQRVALTEKLERLVHQAKISLLNDMEKDPHMDQTGYASTFRVDALDATDLFEYGKSGQIDTAVDTIQKVYQEFQLVDELSRFNQFRDESHQVSNWSELRSVLAAEDGEMRKAAKELRATPEFGEWSNLALTFPLKEGKATAQIASGLDPVSRKPLTQIVLEAPAGNEGWLSEYQYCLRHDFSGYESKPDIIEAAKSLGGKVLVFTRRPGSTWTGFGFYDKPSKYTDRSAQCSMRGLQGWRVIDSTMQGNEGVDASDVQYGHFDQ